MATFILHTQCILHFSGDTQRDWSSFVWDVRWWCNGYFFFTKVKRKSKVIWNFCMSDRSVNKSDAYKSFLNRHGTMTKTLWKCVFLLYVKWYKFKLRTINTFKYHVSCTDGKISVRIILIAYFSTVVPLTRCVFFPVGLQERKHNLWVGRR